MILNKLAEFAVAENLVPDLDFETRPVAYIIVIDDAGKFIQLKPTEGKNFVRKDKSTIPLPLEMSIPFNPTRTSGAAPRFLVDNAKYVLGAVATDKSAKQQAKIRKCTESFYSLISEAKAAHPAIGSVLKFATNKKSVAACLAERLKRAGRASNLRDGDLFAFMLDSDGLRCVHDIPEVQQWWKAKSSKNLAEGTHGTCVITGKSDVQIMDTHPKVSGIVKDGLSLISYNGQTSCESYGWTGIENSPISREIAIRYAAALNKMLRDPDHNFRLSGNSKVVFWTDKPTTDVINGLPSIAHLLNGSPSEIKKVYASVYTGRHYPLADSTTFYSLTLRGTQGRVSPTNWTFMSVGDVLLHIKQYFDDLKLFDDDFLIPDWQIEQALGFRKAGKEKDGILPAFAGLHQDLYEAAVFGSPFPRMLAQHAISRFPLVVRLQDEKVDGGQNRSSTLRILASLMKAFVNRTYRFSNAGKVIAMGIDAESTSIGNVLGRMLFLYGKLQSDSAGGERNHGVFDLFGPAMRTPHQVFPGLAAKSQHHLKKMRNEGKRWCFGIERRLAALCSKLSGTFPATLSLEEQCQFSIGFYKEQHANTELQEANKQAKAEREEAGLQLAQSGEVPSEE